MEFEICSFKTQSLGKHEKILEAVGCIKIINNCFFLIETLLKMCSLYNFGNSIVI